MDVLKPEMLYIKGRCYRINPTDINLNDVSTFKKNCPEFRNYYEEETCTVDYSDPDEEENDCIIESIDGNRYRTAFHVAKTYFPLIIGTRGATRKRLETETKTQITVPKPGQEGDIVITGQSKTGILNCYRRINLIIITARRRQQYTHFISIPFCGEQIKNRFLEFKKDVLENCKDRGIEESVFQSPEKLHMTLCTMVLSDDVERNNAAQVLQKCKTEVIDNFLQGQTLLVRLHGIEIMNDDPAEVHVVYGTLHSDDEEKLQTLVDAIVNYCAKARIIEKEYDKVKQHITLMNTSFCKSSDFGNEGFNKRNRNTINATNLLKMYEKFDFGEEIVSTIHLSQMGTVSSNGYYKPSVVVNIS